MKRPQDWRSRAIEAQQRAGRAAIAVDCLIRRCHGDVLFREAGTPAFRAQLADLIERASAAETPRALQAVIDSIPKRLDDDA